MTTSALEVLRRSLESGQIDEFNSWRKTFPYNGVKLANADLREADLRKANLAHADLRSANLEGADLSEATLMGADLSDANLHGAKLDGVSYAFATLSRAQLDMIEEQNRATVRLLG